jgi:hypothetical protein
MVSREMEQAEGGPGRASSDTKERDRRANRLSKAFFLAGAVLLVLTLSSFWLGSILSQNKGEPAGPQVDPALIPLVSGVEPIPEIFTKAGCPVCHRIPGIPGAEGRVGPPLVLGVTGPARLADPAYRGEATTVREYVIESILSPGTYVVAGFPAHAMPRWYGQKLSAGAVEKIATYLESLREEASAQTP